jgi:hypothetical protein
MQKVLNMGPGTILKNGAEVLMLHADTAKIVILAKSSAANSAMPFVTWRADADGNCFWGHYFKTELEGVKDFHERAGGPPYPSTQLDELDKQRLTKDVYAGCEYGDCSYPNCACTVEVKSGKVVISRTDDDLDPNKTAGGDVAIPSQ